MEETSLPRTNFLSNRSKVGKIIGFTDSSQIFQYGDDHLQESTDKCILTV